MTEMFILNVGREKQLSLGTMKKKSILKKLKSVFEAIFIVLKDGDMFWNLNVSSRV